MARMMSVRLTEDAVRERRKTVTRRKGWWRKDDSPLVTPGDELRLVRQAMGLRRGDTVVDIARVRVVSVRRELLGRLTADLAYGFAETTAEGFPEGHPLHWPSEFIARFFTPQGLTEADLITRIEWEYLPDPKESP